MDIFLLRSSEWVLIESHLGPIQFHSAAIVVASFQNVFPRNTSTTFSSLLYFFLRLSISSTTQKWSYLVLPGFSFWQPPAHRLVFRFPIAANQIRKKGPAIETPALINELSKRRRLSMDHWKFVRPHRMKLSAKRLLPIGPAPQWPRNLHTKQAQ